MENALRDALVAVLIRVLISVVMRSGGSDITSLLAVLNVDVSDWSIGVGRVVVLEINGNRAHNLCLASLRHLKRWSRLQVTR